MIAALAPGQAHGEARILLVAPEELVALAAVSREARIKVGAAAGVAVVDGRLDGRWRWRRRRQRQLVAATVGLGLPVVPALARRHTLRVVAVLLVAREEVVALAAVARQAVAEVGAAARVARI